MPSWTEPLTLVACLLTVAFCSASETALVSLGQNRARRLVEAASGRHWLRLWVDEPERVLTTLLIGNTCAAVLASIVAEDVVEALGIPHSVAVATGVMTLLVLVVGEVTPKSFAQRNAESVAGWVMPVVQLVCLLMWPIARPVVALTHHLFGRMPVGVPRTSEDEIEYLIDLGTRDGVLDDVKERLLNSVLEFADIRVKEIMVPRTRVVALDRNRPAAELMKLLAESEHARLPVVAGSMDEVVGVVHIKDVLKDLHRGQKAEEFRIGRYIRAPFFVPELMKISRLLQEFQKRKTHLAVVVDEFGGTAGIVSLEDVLEQIVGEIRDEYDADDGAIRALPEGGWVVQGEAPLRDVEEALQIAFPEEGDFETLGGFVSFLANGVPPAGAMLRHGDWQLVVRRADARRVIEAELRRLHVGSPEQKETEGQVGFRSEPRPD